MYFIIIMKNPRWNHGEAFLLSTRPSSCQPMKQVQYPPISTLQMDTDTDLVVLALRGLHACYASCSATASHHLVHTGWCEQMSNTDPKAAVFSSAAASSSVKQAKVASFEEVSARMLMTSSLVTSFMRSYSAEVLELMTSIFVAFHDAHL
jgi:hypothetical protein